jgi:dynein heavy chain
MVDSPTSGAMEHLPPDAVRAFFVDRMQLPGFFGGRHWQEAHHNKAAEWLEDPEQKALYVWMQEDALVLSSMSRKGEAESRVQDRLPPPILQGAVQEFMYFFKRDPGAQITEANLRESVVFGLSRGDLLDGLVAQMNNIYVPVALLEHGWPDNVRKDFTSQVQKFMATVTEMTYQAKGKTVLYIPQDSFTNLEIAAKDKDIVQRLEMALIHWTRQIKEVTTQQDSMQEGDGNNGPLDEIRFWEARDNNLSRLHEQLQSSKLQRILTILEMAKSQYLKSFRSLENDIRAGSIEAKENLRFLQFLEEPCQQLAAAAPPEIPAILPAILNYVRMIWAISTHYSKEDRISGLLRKTSNEIIGRCRQTIELEDIFNGKMESSMKQLQESIDCGKEWKQAYLKTCRLIAKNTDRPWNFPEGTIFANIDAFVQRCTDLLEVCEGLQQFACFRFGAPMPAFGGTRATEVSKSLMDIETLFLEHLQKLRVVDYDLLDIRPSQWPDDFTTFKNGMRDLEVMYKNVINSTFDGVGTIQQACEVLDNFHQLARRDGIKGYVKNKGEWVYSFLSGEMNHIANIKREFETMAQSKKTLLPVILGHPHFAGVALATKGLMLRIEKQMECLDNLVFLEPSAGQDSAKEQYANLHGNLESFVLQRFQEWVHELRNLDEAQLPERLQVGLLQQVQQVGKQAPQLLESNFDKELVKMFQEVYYWEKIQGSGVVVPYAAHDLASQRDSLRVLREWVLCVVRDYNIVIMALLPEERKLFQHHIRNLEGKVKPGLSSSPSSRKFTWTQHGIKEFFVKDSRRECAKVYDYVKQFKRNNALINQICRQVSEMHLIKIEKKIVHRDDEFRHVQELRRVEVQKQFKEAHEKIADYMLQSYQFFESHPNDIQSQWKQYVEKVDKRIEEALKKTVKQSLQDLCRALNGDTKTEPSPLFKINAILDDTKMDFKPAMNQLKDLLQHVCRDMTMTLQVVPRLGEHLMMQKAERDRAKKQAFEEAGDVAAANAIVLPSEEEIKKTKKKTFFEEISKDDECCIKYVKDVLRGFNNCAVKLGERLKFWNSSYQPIVSQDKDTFIRRYKKTERSLTVVGQDNQR